MKNRNLRVRSGFTLIELLVVIAIIGILASVIYASLNTAKLKARDARRMGDIDSLQKALTIYYSDNHESYPVAAATTTLDGTDSVSSALISAQLLSNTPLDPSYPNPGFVYTYHSATGDTYDIGFCLETTSIQGRTADCNNAISP